MGSGRWQQLAGGRPPALLPVLVVCHDGCCTAGSAGGGCRTASEGAVVKRLSHETGLAEAPMERAHSNGGHP